MSIVVHTLAEMARDALIAALNGSCAGLCCMRELLYCLSD